MTNADGNLFNKQPDCEKLLQELRLGEELQKEPVPNPFQGRIGPSTEAEVTFLKQPAKVPSSDTDYSWWTLRVSGVLPLLVSQAPD